MMLTDVTHSNGTGSKGTFVSGASKAPEAKSGELEALKKQSEEIAEILSGSRDSVEISDAARTRSEVAKAVQAQNAASVADPEFIAPPLETPEDDTAAVEIQKSMDTREGREAIATDYNAYLEDLRGKYGEEEAMRRFDEFMASEGFEKVEPPEGITYDSFGTGINGHQVGKNSIDPTARFDSMTIHMQSAGGKNLTDAFHGYGDRYRNHSNLRTHSTLNSLYLDGKQEYVAETTATFVAGYSDDVLKAVDSFFNRNIEKLQGEVGFDLAAEMKKHSPTGQVSAVSVNTDLAAITNDLLKRAGMELEAGQSLSLRLVTDGGGNVTGLGVGDLNGGGYDERLQKVIDNAIATDPGLLQAFADEHNKTAADVESLNGQYGGEGSSVDYVHTGRTFILSGDDPSAMIMADHIGVQSTGHTYQKKVSDSFDPNADTIGTTVKGGTTDELAQKIEDALENSTTLESTISKDDFFAHRNEVHGVGYDRIQKAKITDEELAALLAQPGMIDPNSQAATTGMSPAPATEKPDTFVETEKKPDSPVAVPAATDDDGIITIDDGKGRARQMAISAIVEMLNSQRRAIGGGISNLFRPWN